MVVGSTTQVQSVVWMCFDAVRVSFEWLDGCANEGEARDAERHWKMGGRQSTETDTAKKE